MHARELRARTHENHCSHNIFVWVSFSVSLRVCECLLLGTAPTGKRLPPKPWLLLLLSPSNTHIHTHTHTRTHARAIEKRESYARMRVNYAHARTKIIVPTTYLFGSPFLCPCECVCVSCWERRLPARVCHRNRGYCYYCPPTYAKGDTDTHACTRTTSKTA